MAEKSKQRQTAERLVAAFGAMDTATIMELRTPDCMRTIFPTSQGYSPMNNDQVGRLMERLTHVFRNFSLEVLDLVEDAEQRKVVLFLRASGDTDVGQYVNEYVWRLRFNPAGDRVDDWWEFTDASMTGFFTKLQAAMRARDADAATAAASAASSSSAAAAAPQ